MGVKKVQMFWVVTQQHVGSVSYRDTKRRRYPTATLTGVGILPRQ